MAKRLIKYPQPYSIRPAMINEALDYHLRMKEHKRAKYQANKQARRLFDEKNTLKEKLK